MAEKKITPKTKTILKVLACYWFASICMTVVLGGEGHADAPFSRSPWLMPLLAPLGTAIAIPVAVLSVFNPRAWPDLFRMLLAFGVPFLLSMSIAFQRPERWYQFFKRD